MAIVAPPSPGPPEPEALPDSGAASWAALAPPAAPGGVVLGRFVGCLLALLTLAAAAGGGYLVPEWLPQILSLFAGHHG